jgi:hypothetical protein
LLSFKEIRAISDAAKKALIRIRVVSSSSWVNYVSPLRYYWGWEVAQTP